MISHDKHNSATQYRVIDVVKQTPASEILQVFDRRRRKTLALKRVRKARGDSPSLLKKEFAELTYLNHPNVVKVYDFGETTEFVYYTMDFYGDRDLNHVEFNPRDLSGIVDLAAQILGALDFVHRRGIVHGDIKPSNVFVASTRPRRRFLLGDFGLLRLIGADGEQVISGTMEFIAPEVFRGVTDDPRSDLYSLGLLLFFLLAKRFPFRPGDDITKVKKEAQYDYLELSAVAPHVDRRFGDFVGGFLHHNPAKRYITAYEALLRLNDVAAETAVPIADEIPLSHELATGKVFGYGGMIKSLADALGKGPGSPRCFVIKGARGTGKTAVIRELGKLTQLKGGRYLYVDCALGLGAKNPRVPEALAAVQRTAPKPQTGADDLWALLASSWESPAIFPGLAEYLAPDRGKTPASGVLTLVALDNVDPGNDQVVESVFRFMQASIGENVFYAVAFRDGGVPGDKTLEERLLNGGTVPLPVLKVELKGLTPAATEEYVKYLLGASTVSSRLLKYLKTQGKGNPLKVRTALEVLIDERILRRNLQGWEFDSAKLSTLKIPVPPSGSYTETLVRLSEDEKRAVQTAAAYGYAFPGDLLNSPAAFQNLVRRNIFKKPENRHGEYCFADVELWRSLAERLDWARDRGPLSAVIEYLDRKSTLGPAEIGVKGKTYLRLGNVARARADLCRAAEIAAGNSDYDEAIELWELARATEGGWDNAAYERLLTGLAEAYSARGEFGEALKYYRLLRPLRGKAAKDDTDLALKTARAQIAVGAYGPAAKELARVLQSNRNAVDRSKGLALTAWSYYRANDVARAKAYARSAGACAEQTGRDELIAYAKYVLGVILLYSEKTFSPASAELEGAAALARKVGDRRLEAATCNFLGDLYAKTGNHRKAEGVLKRALEAAREARDGYNVALALLGLGHLNFWKGFVRRADEYLAMAAAESQPLDNAHLLAAIYLYSAANMIRAGEYRKAEFYFDQINRLAVDLGPIEGNVLYHRASLYAETGRFDEALAALDRADAAFAGRAPRSQIASVKSLRGRISYRRGEVAAAKAELNACRELVAGTEDDFELAKISYYAAEHALAVGNIDEAARRNREAKSLFRKRAKYYHLGECHLLGAKVALHRWRLQPAPENVHVAERELRRAKSLLNKLGVVKYFQDIFVLESELSMSKRPRNGERNETLGALTKYVKALTEQADLTSLLNSVLAFLTAELGADRGVVFLFDDYKNVLRIKSTAGVDEATIEDASTISRTIVNRVAGSKETVVSADALYDSRFQESQSVRLNRIRSLLCLPLTVGGASLGVIYLDSLTKDDLFQDDDLMLAEVFVQNAAYEIGRRSLETPNVSVSAPSAPDFGYDCLVGSSPEVRYLKAEIEKAATNPINVLAVGESGTGKELVAKMIHYNGFNADKPFIAINCAALPESLLESELFGIEKGTATGVDKRLGRFEQAGEGTIFLDEIGALDLKTQAKFLRVLQERQFERLGARRGDTITLRARIISATNADLERLLDDGRFREDLYFRLNVYQVHVQPLREHKDDIPELCDHFIAKYYSGPKMKKPRLGREVLEIFYRYDWPGNVRELENCVQYALVNALGTVVEPRSIPPTVLTAAAGAPASENAGTLTEAVAQLERELVLNALRDAGWVKARAAAKLGISEANLRYKMKKYAIKAKRRPAAA